MEFENLAKNLKLLQLYAHLKNPRVLNKTSLKVCEQLFIENCKISD